MSWPAPPRCSFTASTDFRTSLSSGKFETIVLFTWMRGMPASASTQITATPAKMRMALRASQGADARHHAVEGACGPPRDGVRSGSVSRSSCSTAGAKVIAAIAASATPIPP